MRLEVHSNSLELTPELSSRIQEQAVSAFSRFGRRIGRVIVRLAGAEGAGGVTTCHVLVALHPFGGLAVAEVAASPARAVDRAFGRAAPAVGRELARRRSLPSSDRRALDFVVML